MNDPNVQIHFDPYEERGNARNVPALKVVAANDSKDLRLRKSAAAEHGPRARLSLLEQLELLADWKRGAVLLIAVLVALAGLVLVLDGLLTLVGALV